MKTLSRPVRGVPLYLWLAVAGWTAVFATYAILRYDRFNASLYDLAIKTQVIWNTANGRFFASSVEVQHYLGDHVQFIFLLLAPLYRLLPDPRLLLVVQAAVLCLGALPVYRLAAKRLTATSHLPTLFAFAYLLYPVLGFVNRFDFHPIVFTAPLLLFALNSIDDLRTGGVAGSPSPIAKSTTSPATPPSTTFPLRATLFLLLTLSLREESGLTLFALGLFVAVIWKMPRFGLTWAAIGLAYSLFAFFVIIPTFRGADSDTLGRYAYLGEDALAIVQTLLTRPFFVLQHQFGDGLRLIFLGKLFLPLGFLSLLAPAALFPALPALGYNLLADSPNQSSIYFQYVTPAIPFFFLAAIEGAKRLRNWAPPKTAVLIPTALLLAGTTFAWLLDNPFTQEVGFPLFPVYGIAHSIDPAPYRAAAALIPPDASLATMMAYGPHQANREQLFLFYDRGEFEKRPFGFQQADYLLLHLTDLRWDVNPRLFYASIETAIGHLSYEAVYFENDVLLLQQGAEPNPQATGAALARVIELTEAGGKFAPTSEALLAYLTQQWQVDAVPESATVLNQSYPDGLTLLAQETAVSPTLGAPLCTTLYLTKTAESAPPDDLTIFLHLAAADGFVHAQRDVAPTFGYQPPAQWPPDTIHASLHCLQIPPWLQPGDYQALIGLYEAESGERWKTAENQDAINLLQFTIP